MPANRDLLFAGPPQRHHRGGVPTEAASADNSEPPCNGANPPAELVTNGFLFRTVGVWQPKSGRDLTPEDAREIISNASGFFRVLAEWDRTTSGATPDDEGGS